MTERNMSRFLADGIPPCGATLVITYFSYLLI